MSESSTPKPEASQDPTSEQLDIYLTAVEQREAAGEEVPDADKQFLLEVGVRVKTVKTVLSEGKSWGGVEIPEVSETHYDLAPVTDDGSEPPIRLSDDLGRRLTAYYWANKPKPKADPAAPKPGRMPPAPKRGEIGDMADDLLERLAQWNVAPKSPRYSTRRADIRDLVRLDRKGRARYTSGVQLAKGADGNYLSGDDAQVTGNLAGQLMSKEELDMLEKQASFIRNHEVKRKVENDEHKAANDAHAQHVKLIAHAAPREIFRRGLYKSPSIIYKDAKHGDPLSGKASAEEVERRIEDMMTLYDKDGGYDYIEGQGFVPRQPQQEQLPLRRRVAGALGRLFT